MIALAFSRFYIRALPIPPYTENFSGHPILTSTPQMSGNTFSTAFTAVSGELDPIYNIK
jgi:hypothetical protein